MSSAPKPVTESQLLELVRKVPDMLCIADAEGVFQWVSPRFAQVLGYAPEELVGTPSLDLSHPADLSESRARLAQMADGATTLDFEVRTRCADGSWRWLQWNAAPDGDGTLYACARDITDRKAFETRLSERTRLVEMAESLAGVGHWRVSLAENRLTWSPQVYRIHGLDPAEYRPTVATAIDAYHADDRAMVQSSVARALERGEAYDFEARIVRADGEIRHVRSVGVPEFGPDGEIEAIFGVIQDVTEARIMAEAMRRSERMASLGTMAAGIAHEINNPLGYLVGNLELIEEALGEIRDRVPHDVHAELTDMLSSSLEGGARIRRIVESMRQFSHVGAGELRPVSMAGVVDAACQMAMHQIRPRARLVRTGEADPPVAGDETQLTQVVLNLLVNAAQALPTGHADDHRIEVALEDRVSEVVLQVADTGPGIPEDARSRVFDPFFTTKPVGTGTGLGLTIAHSIVEQHGGSLSLANRAEGGCVVTVRLPMAEPATEAAAPPPEPMVEDDRRPRILVVDDEEQTLRLLKRALGEGFAVEVAASGQEALDRLAADSRFDLILCDLMMPTVSGMEVHAHLIREFPGLARRFVIATGGAFTAEAERFLVASDVPVIRKPFRLRTLREQLLDYIPG